MKKSMDLFGRSLYHYWKGDRKSPYFIIYKGKKQSRNNKRYFRSYSQLSSLEKKLISLARGKILDIGCATGYYIPPLEKKGQVEGIDISEWAIRVAREKYKLKNVYAADIFNFKTSKQYDTITLLENNLGMGGSPKGTLKLLRIIKQLLKPNGQVLMIQRDIGKNYLPVILESEYKGERDTFKWCHFSMEYVKKMSKDVGFYFELIHRNKSKNTFYLARLTKR